MESAFRVILFTDMVDSTRLTQQLGDREVMRLVREHDTIVRAALAQFGGSEVKHTGDGIMASFTSASQAVRAAMQVQRALQKHNEAERSRFQIRIGVAAGEPITEHGDLFGAAAAGRATVFVFSARLHCRFIRGARPLPRQGHPVLRRRPHRREGLRGANRALRGRLARLTLPGGSGRQRGGSQRIGASRGVRLLWVLISAYCSVTVDRQSCF